MLVGCVRRSALRRRTRDAEHGARWIRAALRGLRGYAVTVSAACGPVTSDTAALGVFCRVDWDQSGAVEPADVAAFESDWFIDLQFEFHRADFDGSGTTDPGDVGAFVAAWFARLNGGPC